MSPKQIAIRNVVSVIALALAFSLTVALAFEYPYWISGFMVGFGLFYGIKGLYESELRAAQSQAQIDEIRRTK